MVLSKWSSYCSCHLTNSHLHLSANLWKKFKINMQVPWLMTLSDTQHSLSPVFLPPKCILILSSDLHALSHHSIPNPTESSLPSWVESLIFPQQCFIFKAWHILLPRPGILRIHSAAQRWKFYSSPWETGSWWANIKETRVTVHRATQNRKRKSSSQDLQKWSFKLRGKINK